MHFQHITITLVVGYVSMPYLQCTISTPWEHSLPVVACANCHDTFNGANVFKCGQSFSKAQKFAIVQILKIFLIDVTSRNRYMYKILVDLKEKLPQAFMQTGWMEDDFRNPTAKVWANLDNPIKRYDFSKVSLILCMLPSQVALF